VNNLQRMVTEMCRNSSYQCQLEVGTTKLSAGRRRRTRATSFLTAAALHLVVPTSTDAFVTPTGRAASSPSTCGPLHATLSSSSTSAPLHESAASLTDGGNVVSRQPLLCRTSGFLCHSPVASAAVPSTAFLSSNQNSLSIPGTVSKYGGRASGSVAGDIDDDLLVSSPNTLGFVVVDDRLPRESLAGTSLGISRSTPGPSSDQVDGASFLDNRGLSAGSGRGDSKNAKGGSESTVRTIDSDSTSASEVTRRVAASLLRSTSAGGVKDNGWRADSAASPLSVVPAWFPWIPTRSQIETLKMSELREACVERGLAKNGRRGELEERLMGWTTEQHRRRVENRRSGMSSSVLGSNAAASEHRTSTPLGDMIEDALGPGKRRVAPTSSSPSPTSTTGDIESLFNRRKALREAKDAKDKPLTAENEEDTEADDNAPPTEEDLSKLAQTFNSPTAKFSNYEVKEMYQRAKFADKAGDRRLAKKLLVELLDATPKDSRILRRLSRMEVEEGNISGARQILQNGIRRNPDDANLLHGLATLEAKHGSVDAARGLYKEAIRSDPSQPNAYHALGTMEHSRGNIRVATAVLRHGIKHCPTNHRLHHALGDLYREAQMLDLSELAYRKSLKHSPEWGKSFAYTALSYLSYDKGDRSDCRRWLQESLEVNKGSHSQGWLALAQLEESDGHLITARSVYNEGLGQYERSMSRKRSRSNRPSRSGDKWIFVYRSWARMELHHGTYESANAVYERATRVYPNHSVLFLGWAKLHAKHGLDDRARSLFKIACDKAGSRSAEPYTTYAEFEMSRGDYSRAKSILYLGAQELSESMDVVSISDGLAHLFHTWALCEWHLDNYDRAEKLFDHSLRMTDAGEKGSDVRSRILYSLAQFFFGAKKDYILAQHCICLALKDTVTPGRYPQLWRLWADIAEAQGNESLAQHCKEQQIEFGHDVDVYSNDVSSSSLPMMTAPAMRNMLRKAPWHHKLAGIASNDMSWREEIPYPCGTSDQMLEEEKAEVN